MEHATEDNRRRWPRFPMEMRVELFAGQREVKAYGRAVDLSEGGLSVLTVDKLKIGEQFTIAFTIPQTNQPFRMECVVRTQEGYRYGLEFLNVRQADRKELAEFGRILKILGKA